MGAEAYPRKFWPTKSRSISAGRSRWRSSGEVRPQGLDAYLRVAVWIVGGAAGSWAAYELGHFLLASPEMALVHPEQIELAGTHYVAPRVCSKYFAADRGQSVLRIPLDERRRQLEALPWVEQATVRRVLPNRIEVEIAERTPVAFLRESSDLALVDVHGVILERPLEGNFHFPVVTGIGADMPLEDREKRMQLYSGFAQQIETAHAGAVDQVSEVDLSDAVTCAPRSRVSPAPTRAGTRLTPRAGAFRRLRFCGQVSDAGRKYRAVAREGRIGRIGGFAVRREAVVNPDVAAVAQHRRSSNPVVAQARPAKSAVAQNRPGKPVSARPAKKSTR